MNTEPPTGDDLQRMLVSMKHHVLEHAEDRRPARRRHRPGIVVAAVALLALGTASGAVALAVVPQQQTAAPTASAAPPTPRPTTTTSSAPVIETPIPETTPTATPPTATPTRRPFDATDPGTWTISGAEVGPIALGGAVDAELDDVALAYDRLAGEPGCPPPGVNDFDRPGAVSMIVLDRDGVVTGIAVGLLSTYEPRDLSANPSTAAGVGISSTLADLRAAYPDLVALGTHSDPGATGGEFSMWSVHRDGRFITFELDPDERVGLVWVGATAVVPNDFC
jgi:hypothetical protein